MKMKTGTIINQYKVISAIGKGGMGEVFLAQDTKLERQVALKVLLAEIAANEDRVRRFVQEAKAASALNHPNILTVHEIGEFENLRYIATEFIKGETLRERLNGEPMTLRETLDITMQVAAALHAAHAAGIVHRDIKPENVMLRDDGFVKVLDFGLAKLTEKHVTKSQDEATLLQPEIKNRKSKIKNLTAPGMVMGTVAYMSPEQTRGKEVDARSDIWSLGVVVYEMLTRRTPFAGETPNDSIAAILAKEPVPLDEKMPSELQRIIKKSLQKKADERYQTIKDFLLDVKNLKKELELAEELERSNFPDSIKSSSVGTNQISENATAVFSAANSTQNSLPQAVSSAEYIVTQVKRGKYWILTLAVLAVAGIGFGVYRYSGKSPVNISFEGAKITRLTSSGKVAPAYFAISSDGKWLVYANQDSEQQSLWLKQVAIPDSNSQIIPPGDVFYQGLAFSPDGNYLYYSVYEKGAADGTLYQVPVLGGTARKLLTGISSQISFSPDGKKISYYYYNNNDETRLMIANADGTEQRQLAVRKGNEYFNPGSGSPAWSPDGKTIATHLGFISPAYMGMATVSVTTGEVTLVSSQKFDGINNLNWLADGKSLVFLATENAVSQPSQIWQMSYPSGEAKKISNELNGYAAISLTADSNALAVVQAVRTSNIWTMPNSDTAQVKQVTSGSDLTDQPVWTPDGRLVYSRNFSGGRDLFLVDPQGGGSPKQLTSNAGVNATPTVSPDGKNIVFSSNRTGTFAIWRMAIDGSNPQQLTDNGFDVVPSFSPDGREIIFSRTADKNRIWKVLLEGGEPVQLTDKESNFPRYSPDGKQFICIYQDDPKSPMKLAIFASSGGSPVKFFDPPKNWLPPIWWMPDGRSIAYTVTKGGVDNIWTQPLEGGTPKQITNFTSEQISWLDFSPDGKQIALARGTRTSDVVLISGIKK